MVEYPELKQYVSTYFWLARKVIVNANLNLSIFGNITYHFIR